MIYDQRKLEARVAEVNNMTDVEQLLAIVEDSNEDRGIRRLARRRWHQFTKAIRNDFFRDYIENFR
jgi:hypothetical protein